jgi:TolB-like protein
VVLVQAGPLAAYEREMRSLAATLAAAVKDHGKKVVAVVDFTDLEGNPNELGRFVAEELAGDLINTNMGFDVVDRNHLKSILAENKLSMSGIVDPDSVRKLGKIAGADALITGSLTPFGDSIRISCKAIDMFTAKVIGVAKGDIAKTAAIADLLNTGEKGEKTKPSAGQAVSVKLEGQYSAMGRNPNGTTYSGIVTITKRSEAYLFVWKIGSTTYSGTGSLDGNILTVEWGAPYPVIYAVQPDGRLIGTWNNGTATENLIPLQ